MPSMSSFSRAVYCFYGFGISFGSVLFVEKVPPIFVMEIKLQPKKKPQQKTAKANVFARPSKADQTKIVPTVDKKKNEAA